MYTRHINIILSFFSLWMVSVNGVPQGAKSLEPPSSICGNWTIKRIIPTPNVQASPDSMKRFLGQKATYLTAQMKFGDESVDNSSYSVETLSEDDLLDQFGVSFKQLSIHGGSVAAVQVLDSSGKKVIAPGAVLFVRDKNTIITTWDGIFLELVRKGACPSPRLKMVRAPYNNWTD